MPTESSLRWSGSREAQKKGDEAYRAFRSKENKRCRTRKRVSAGRVSSDEMRPGCVAFLEWIATANWRAARRGINIEFSVVSARGKKTLHVMFKDQRGRMLAQYWPGNGTVKLGANIATGSQSKAATPDEVLELAIQAAELRLRQRT